MPKSKDWQFMGLCHADTAMLLIGDPCYSAHDNHPEHPIHNWGELCKTLDEADKAGKRGVQLNHARGHAGCGVIVRTGYDGQFVVEGRFNAHGDMVEIRIRPDSD